VVLSLLRLSNNSKTEGKERQIEIQIQKEEKILVPKTIVRQLLLYKYEKFIRRAKEEKIRASKS
jgi:DNA recombination-dependent growth factor C